MSNKKATLEKRKKELQFIVDEEYLSSFTSYNGEEVSFLTTEDVKPLRGLDKIIGQTRAKRQVLKTLMTHLSASHCMTMGEPGTGKSYFFKTAIETLNDLIQKNEEEPGFIESEIRRLKEKRGSGQISEHEIALAVAKDYSNLKLYDQVVVCNFKDETTPKTIYLPQDLILSK